MTMLFTGTHVAKYLISIGNNLWWWWPYATLFFLKISLAYEYWKTWIRHLLIL